MFSSLLAAAITFISCHTGPADHFATFAEELTRRGHQVEIYATGPALQKFKDRASDHVTGFSLTGASEEEKAFELVNQCPKDAIVITDVGHSFDIALQSALKKQEILGIAYYDNPEAYVPGGYSETAAKVMALSQKVFFANANLANNDDKEIGIGYYPIAHAAKIAQRRITDRETIRAQLFSEWGFADQGQKIVVYVGGNNHEYFSKALPAFLGFLTNISEDLPPFIVMLQQHPGAKEKNLDANLVQQMQEPRIFVSTRNSDDAQIVADHILYYQTSMGPQFILAAIPTTQVGHIPYEDILVKNHLCSVATSSEELIRAFTEENTHQDTNETITEKLGIRNDWADRLEKAISN